MILDIIFGIIVIGLIVFLFVASTILVWEKQHRKHLAARKWMREVKKNERKWGGETFQGNKK